MMQVTDAEDPSPAEGGTPRSPNGLYRVGGAAALIAAVVFRRNWGAEFSLLRSLGIIHVGPTVAPGSAVEWLLLLQENRFVGLILLNLFDMVNYALVGLIFLALYAALRRGNEGAMAIAVAFGLIGVAVYFSSNQALTMLALSQRYAAAATEAQRSIVLATGEALLAIDNPGATNPGTGSTLSLPLATLSSLIISIVMLRSDVFSRVTAYVGLVGESFQLCHFIVVPLAPALLALPTSLAAPFRLVWYVLIGRRLLHMASGAPSQMR
jgi:hypothetical protein